MKSNQLIVVLGMHRSGTSAITRGLQVMGVGLGDRMMPPVDGNNIKGFWEDIDLNALNIEMLRAIDSDWHHLVSIASSDVATLRNKGYFLRAVELLRQKVSGTPVFGFKDPRVAKLLPFWKEVFNHCHFHVDYVLAVRNPLSVVKSLAKRDGIEAEHAYFLWLGYVIRSLVDSAANNRILVDYDLLMQSPDHELSRIAKQFDLIIDPVELKRYKAEFLDLGLRHTVYHFKDLSLDGACPPLVREMYAELLNVATEKVQINDSALQQKIEHWVNEFERINASLTLSDRLFAQKTVALQAVAEREGQIASYRAQIEEFSHQVSSLQSELSFAQTHIAHQSSELQAYRTQAEEFSRQVSSLQSELDFAQTHIAHQSSELQTYRTQAEEFSHQVSSLQSELDFAQTHIAHQASELQAYRTQAEEFSHQVSSLQSELSFAQMHIAHQSSELQAYQTQAEEFSRQVSSLRMQRSEDLANARFLLRQLSALIYSKLRKIFSGKNG